MHKQVVGLVVVMGVSIGFSTSAVPVAKLAAQHRPVPATAFIKEGMGRYQHPAYQYECLGLGGTTLRVGPDGFTGTAAVGVSPGGGLEHKPYLAYQYWWDEEGHRHYPFILSGGYGEDLEAGQVTCFRHELDIQTGVLTIDLGLQVDGPAGSDRWQSRREEFVTPDGVLVIRVTDTPEARAPFRLRVQANENVCLYHNGGIYARKHEPWTAAALAARDGFTVVGTRPRSCTATLAVALAAAEPTVDPTQILLGAGKPGQSVTLYIAPGSSYETLDPAAFAWQKADRARSLGFDALRRTAADWWGSFYGQSSVDLPDPDLAVWYARSLYYHGVFFGNTDVPPGCNGTGPLFSGAICPEYDLVFNQLALLYSGHFDEARRVTGWLGRVLPRAERYATEGLTLHKVSVKYPSGAIYGPLIGYDGTIPVPPTEGEGSWAFERYPGANAALMALSYVDWTHDARYHAIAKRILKGTTAVSAADLEWRPDLNGYAGKHMGNVVQLAAAAFGLRESVRRGVAEPGWEEMAGKVLLPTADFRGKKVVVVGPGLIPTAGCGDAPWLSTLWWYGNLPPSDPLAHSTYEMICESKTGDYVFNNAWMAVYAAKLGHGDEALSWLHRLLRPGVTLFDDTCLGEIVHDADDFKKTPEIAAHGALICAIAQMLVDLDSEGSITVFPAIPAAWLQHGVAFTNLAARGGVAVSAQLTATKAEVSVQNRTVAAARLDLRVRLPKRWKRLRNVPAGARCEDGWVVIPAVTLAAKQYVTYTLEPAQAATPRK